MPQNNIEKEKSYKKEVYQWLSDNDIHVHSDKVEELFNKVRLQTLNEIEEKIKKRKELWLKNGGWFPEKIDELNWLCDEINNIKPSLKQKSEEEKQ